MMAMMLMAALAWPALASAAPAPAQSAERVSVAVETAAPLPEPLRERIEASVTRVVERLVLGRPVAAIQEQRMEYERIIMEIFVRLLTGYRIEGLVFLVDTEVRIVIQLAPEGPLLDQVAFSLSMPGLKDAGVTLVEREFQNQQEEFSRIFVGVPLKAFDWALPVLIPILETEMRDRFPGFQPGIKVESSSPLALRVTMTRSQPLVGEIAIDVSSNTLPLALVGLWRERARARLGALEGLPVAYLRRNQQEIEKQSAAWLAADATLARLGLTWQVRLYPGITTQVRISVDAEHYSLTAHGNLEISDPPVAGLAFGAGVSILPGWALTGEMAVDTSGQESELRASLIYTLSHEMSLGLTYTTRDAGRLCWLRYVSERGELFVLGADLASEKLSATIGIKLESQLTVALTVDSARQYHLAVQVGL